MYFFVFRAAEFLYFRRRGNLTFRGHGSGASESASACAFGASGYVTQFPCQDRCGLENAVARATRGGRIPCFVSIWRRRLRCHVAPSPANTYL